jgi:hypothetical protein
MLHQFLNQFKFVSLKHSGYRKCQLLKLQETQQFVHSVFMCFVRHYALSSLNSFCNRTVLPLP